MWLTLFFFFFFKCMPSLSQLGKAGVLLLGATVLPPPLRRRKWVSVMPMTTYHCQGNFMMADACSGRYKIISVMDVRSSGNTFHLCRMFL